MREADGSTRKSLHTTHPSSAKAAKARAEKNLLLHFGDIVPRACEHELEIEERITRAGRRTGNAVVGRLETRARRRSGRISAKRRARCRLPAGHASGTVAGDLR